MQRNTYERAGLGKAFRSELGLNDPFTCTPSVFAASEVSIYKI
ncbi:MAG: hypothetical protein ACOC7M_02610 [Chloroflexota bacterium]